MDENASFPPPTPSRRVSRRPAPQVAPQVNDTPNAGATPSRPHHSPNDFSVWKALQSVFSVALVVATLFTMWTPANLFANNLLDSMFKSIQPQSSEPEEVFTPTPSPRPRIGLVAGHWGNDSGSVCKNGVTEEEVNLKIATLTQKILVKEGYEVDLLKEFDPRLTEYKALALVSIHNDSCDFINNQATGFKVAAASSSVFPEKATRLTACLTQRYQQVTGLPFHSNSITNDMEKYHAFSEIHSDTTAAIIETGFLNLDYDYLTKKTDLVAQGVAAGILCYVRNEDVPQSPVVSTAQP